MTEAASSQEDRSSDNEREAAWTGATREAWSRGSDGEEGNERTGLHRAASRKRGNETSCEKEEAHLVCLLLVLVNCEYHNTYRNKHAKTSTQRPLFVHASVPLPVTSPSKTNLSFFASVSQSPPSFRSGFHPLTPLPSFLCVTNTLHTNHLLQ